MSSLNLLRLSRLTDREDFLEIAEKNMALFGDQMKKQPRSLPQMLVALDYYLSKPQHIVIVGDPEASDTQKMLSEVYQKFIPGKMLIVVGNLNSQKDIGKYLPFVKDFTRIDGKATAYVCIDYTCSLPTNDIRTMSRILSDKL